MSITMKGNPLTLVGELPKIGDTIKPFTLLTSGLAPKTQDDYKGKVVVFVSVPSLDTGVCDMEVRKFNELATKLSDDVVILSVSTDLPFAIGRWCGAVGVNNVEALSDHYSASFAEANGLLIKELRLIARAVQVYDKSGKLAYIELVKEQTDEPNYDRAISAIAELA